MPSNSAAKCRLVVTALAALAAAGWHSRELAAQANDDVSALGLGGGLMIRNMRPTGQPVAPIYDGWYFEPDGSVSLCFGYQSLNLEEDVDVPLGPDNFIEPSGLDGGQPTHFDEVPPEYRRRTCVFTVPVVSVEDVEAVVWTLTTRGIRLSAKASGLPYYRIDEPNQASRSSHAPSVTVVEPAVGRAVLGRSGRVDHAMEIQARVDERVALAVRAVAAPGAPTDMVVRMLWTLHQGPGGVTIEGEDATVSGVSEVRHVTAARFSMPGEYVLRLQAAEWSEGNSFHFHCCFTNAYVRVSVR